MTGRRRLRRISPLIGDDAAGLTPAGDDYRPGTCNIGPWEIRRRRVYAIAACAIAVAALAALLVAHAPPAARLALLLPLWGGTFSWLQARRRFCAGFAVAGIVNFGAGPASRRAVTDPAARRADLMAVARMTLDSFVVALILTVLLALLPA